MKVWISGKNAAVYHDPDGDTHPFTTKCGRWYGGFYGSPPARGRFFDTENIDEGVGLHPCKVCYR